MRRGVQSERWLLCGVIALGVVAIPSRSATAQQPQIKAAPARPIGSVEGKDNYTAYCAVCHGPDGKGNGPAAPALKGPMPDLTTIAKRNGGKFDELAIGRVISGTDKARPAHGTVDMPIWGPVFRSMQSDAAASMRTANLVKYLGSLQQK